MDAPTWLRGSTADKPRTIRRDLPNEIAIKFVDAMLKKGAVSVSLAGYGLDIDSSIRRYLLIELPTDAMKRQRIFDFVELDNLQLCNPAVPDEGETHVIHMFGFNQCGCFAADESVDDDDDG